ncbi:MAG: AAA family ATPase [Candidatus Methanomethylophilaceae archaeon]|nr:AAA family ATPase [Candidatus Methanomethylophilaceae archaeon]
MRLIISAGMPGAGKEEFLTAGMDAGVPFIRMGDVVRECYASSGAESKGLSVGEYAGGERKAYGADIWAKRVMERVKSDLCIIDGCRSMDEINSFKKLGGDVTIVAIHASPKIRYERLVKRQRADAPANIGELDERDNRELSWGVGSVLALADHIIDNTGSLEDFHRKSAELMRSLR